MSLLGGMFSESGYDLEVCAACHGAGTYQDLTCPACEGSGWPKPVSSSKPTKESMSNDTDSLDALRDLLALPETDDNRMLEQFGIERLRLCHALMATWMPRVSALLRSADETELALARARVAEIEERLNWPKAVEPPRKFNAVLPVTGVDEVEGGSGLGIAAVEGATAQEFQDELRQLRAHTQAKRRRLT